MGDGRDVNAVLEREAEQHAGVTRDRLDVVPGLAAVNEDFARRAVGKKPTVTVNGGSKIEGRRSLRPGAGGGLAASRGPFHIVAAKRPANKFLQILARLGRGDLPAKPLAEIVDGATDRGW